MPTVNENIRDALLRHRVLLQRVENGAVRRMKGPLRDALDEMLAYMSVLDERALRMPGGPDAPTLELIRRHAAELAAVLAAGGLAANHLLREELQRVIRSEARIIRNLLDRIIPSSLNQPVHSITPADMAAIMQIPIGGVYWEDAVRKMYGRLADDVQQLIQRGFLEGKTVDEMRREAQGLVRDKAPWQLSRLVRTEIQRVANGALLATYRANPHLVEAVQWLATLDDRTCVICGSRDGEVYALEGPRAGLLPEIPAHANCRCVTVPVLVSWKDLGIDAEELPAGTRVAMNGEVPAALTYGEWFTQQASADPAFARRVLGPKRYALWKDNKFDISQFVEDGRTLTLAQLQARLGIPVGESELMDELRWLHPVTRLLAFGHFDKLPGEAADAAMGMAASERPVAWLATKFARASLPAVRAYLAASGIATSEKWSPAKLGRMVNSIVAAKWPAERPDALLDFVERM